MFNFRINYKAIFGLFVFSAMWTSLIVAQAVDTTTIDPSTLPEIIDAVKQSQDITQLLGLDTMILSFVTVIVGYISPFFPGIKDIPNTTWRVAIFAFLVILGFIMFGVGSAWQGAIAYFFSTSLYQLVLKFIVPTPKPQPKPTT